MTVEGERKKEAFMERYRMQRRVSCPPLSAGVSEHLYAQFVVKVAARPVVAALQITPRYWMSKNYTRVLSLMKRKCKNESLMVSH